MNRFTKALSEKGKPLLVLDEFKFRKCIILKNGIKYNQIKYILCSRDKIFVDGTL
jgi:hypothetical protein